MNMNAVRKKTLRKAVDQVVALVEELQAMVDEMESEFSEKSEGWQNGEKGERMRQEIDTIDQAQGDLESAVDLVRDLLEG